MPQHYQAARFVEAIKSSRVDIATFGDSNLYQDTNYGHAYGLREGFWQQNHGVYGSDVINFGQGLSEIHGMTAASGSSQGIIADTNGNTIPATHLHMGLRDSDGNIVSGQYTHGPGWMPNDTESTTPSAVFQSFTIADKSPQDLFNPREDMTWMMRYGTFDYGTGQFVPFIQSASSPLDSINHGTILTNTGENSVVTGSWNIPNSLQSSTLRVQVHDPSDIVCRGPCAFGWQKLIRNAVQTGVTVSRGLYQGGKYTRNAIESVRQWTQASFNEWITGLTLGQGRADKDQMVIFWIMHGANDLNYGATYSLGPNPAIEQTPLGYLDNSIALKEDLQNLWNAGGYRPDNLLFVFSGTHPQLHTVERTVAGETNTYNYWAEQLHLELQQMVDMYPNVIRINGLSLITPEEILAVNGYNNGGADSAHLDGPGFDLFDGRLVREFMSYTYPTPQAGTGSGMLSTPYVIRGTQ